jgi:hypothetical protein
MLQIVASLIDAARGIIYNRHMFIVQAIDVKNLVGKAYSRVRLSMVDNLVQTSLDQLLFTLKI